MATVFHEGDQVVLREGTYQGSTGVFLRLRADVKWADIEEQDGAVRSHPIEWLALAGDAHASVSSSQVEGRRSI